MLFVDTALLSLYRVIRKLDCKKVHIRPMIGWKRSRWSIDTDDDVVIKDLYVVEGLTFVKIFVGQVKQQLTLLTVAGKRFSTRWDKPMAKFTWQRLAIGVSVLIMTTAVLRVTDHIMPIVGPNSDGKWESEAVGLNKVPTTGLSVARAMTVQNRDTRHTPIIQVMEILYISCKIAGQTMHSGHMRD